MTRVSRSIRGAFQYLLVVIVLSLVLSACASPQATPTAEPTKAPPAAQATTAPAQAPIAATPVSQVAAPVAKAPVLDAATEKERVEKLIEGATKEGKLVLYYSLTDADVEALQKGFEKKYPFIKIERYRAGVEQLAQKTIAEAKAGQHISDVNINSSFGFYNAWKENLYQPYISPESKVYPDGVKDKDGYWISPIKLEMVIAYNTDLVKKEDAPKSLADLADPKWKGKLIAEETAIQTYQGTVGVYGEQKAKEIWEGIAKNQPSVRRGHSLIAGQIAAGEMPVFICAYLFSIVDLQKKGAPIEWVRADPVVSELVSIAIMEKAPHPNASKLWVDFVLSEEGQLILRDRGRVSSRPGIQTNPPDLLKGVNILYLSPRDGGSYDKYVDVYRGLLGTK